MVNLLMGGGGGRMLKCESEFGGYIALMLQCWTFFVKFCRSYVIIGRYFVDMFSFKHV